MLSMMRELSIDIAVVSALSTAACRNQPGEIPVPLFRLWAGPAKPAPAGSTDRHP